MNAKDFESFLVWEQHLEAWRYRALKHIPEAEAAIVLWESLEGEAAKTLLWEPLDNYRCVGGINFIVDRLRKPFHTSQVHRKGAYLTRWERVRRRQGESMTAWIARYEQTARDLCLFKLDPQAGLDGECKGFRFLERSMLGPTVIRELLVASNQSYEYDLLANAMQTLYPDSGRAPAVEHQSSASTSSFTGGTAPQHPRGGASRPSAGGTMAVRFRSGPGQMSARFRPPPGRPHTAAIPFRPRSVRLVDNEGTEQEWDLVVDELDEPVPEPVSSFEPAVEIFSGEEEAPVDEPSHDAEAGYDDWAGSSPATASHCPEHLDALWLRCRHLVRRELIPFRELEAARPRSRRRSTARRPIRNASIALRKATGPEIRSAGSQALARVDRIACVSRTASATTF